MAGRRSLRDERGVSGVLAFSVAGLIFLGSVILLLTATRHTATSSAIADPQVTADLTGKARSLAQSILESPGVGASGGDWAPSNSYGGSSPSADNVKRFGLLDASNGTVLSFAKLQNLRMAPYNASLDGYLNYPEAAASLGLDKAGLDFHLRAYPTLRQVQDVLKTGIKDPNLRVTYIGNVGVSQTHGQPPPSNPTQGFLVTKPVCSVSQLTGPSHPQDYRLFVNVTNGGQNATQFNGFWTYQLGSAAQETQNSNSWLVQPGQTVALSIHVPAAGGRSCTVGSTISVKVGDPVSTYVSNSTTISTAVTGATAASKDMTLDTSKTYYVYSASCQNKDHVVLSVGGPDLAKNDQVAVTVNNAANATVVTVQDKLNGNGPWSEDVGCLAAGNYTAYLYYCTGSSACTPAANVERTTEKVLVTTASVGPYVPPGAPAPTGPNFYTPTQESLAEVGFLDSLVNRFCPTYFDGTTNATSYPVDWTARAARASPPTPARAPSTSPATSSPTARTS